MRLSILNPVVLFEIEILSHSPQVPASQLPTGVEGARLEDWRQGGVGSGTDGARGQTFVSHHCYPHPHTGRLAALRQPLFRYLRVLKHKTKHSMRGARRQH